MTSEKQDQIIALIHQEVVPALGCTEPIAVALAVAKARETLGAKPTEVQVWVSPNIYKNGMGVGIPGTAMVGLHIATALAAITGQSSDKLEVLKHVTPDLVKDAQQLVDSGIIHVDAENTDEKLYIKALCTNGTHTSSATIRGTHNNITQVMLNDEVLHDTNYQTDGNASNNVGFDVSIADIYEFATTAPLSKIEFILEGARLNSALSDYGLEHKAGLGVGANMLDSIKQGYISDDLQNRAMAVTAAASDARMSGAMLPAMSNSGSGNQGITAMLPVVSVAKSLNADNEKLCRALIISNLVVIHIKKNFGRLSAACGCVVASTGAACGVTYLLGGTEQQIEYAIKNMIGNLTGMVCDGAKLGCALKVATGTCAAIQSALLAKNNVCISANDGIVEESTERTIKNIGIIASESMNETDRMILQIMTSKQ
ncbi:MAG: L-serine ammonia-lyase, iron-sulfur-dependent, subunit alpha [Bacteroidales bacterium]|jgi:L-cysteine desulfidase|nr:L-serine ammonia-lyase, iron-sulfur-dependent, subunit alpha [Bacteroidales bacterium]